MIVVGLVAMFVLILRHFRDAEGIVEWSGAVFVSLIAATLLAPLAYVIVPIWLVRVGS